MTDKPGSTAAAPPVDFIRAIVDEDIAAGKHHGRVATRFPPEPNGYLHIGHAKSICLNFGIAQERGGTCNLRFDDTNPTKENVEYVDAIKDDVEWLGFAWSAELYASDYFERLYQFAVALIAQGNAYVDSLNADEIRAYRGTLTEPGRNSPYRDRTVEENLALFARMRAVRSGVASEVAQQIRSSASRLGAGPDLSVDAMEFTADSVPPAPQASLVLGRSTILARKITSCNELSGRRRAAEWRKSCVAK